MTRPPHLVTIRQAAKLLRVRRALLRHLVETGRLPVWREGRRIFLDPMSAETAIRRAGVFD